MDKNTKSLIIYIIIALVIILGYIGFLIYRENTLSKTMKSTLQKYFEDNNTHISSHNFDISNVKIRCRGNNAYLVEFNLLLNDSTSDKLNKLGATLYKKNDVWHVKGFGKGLTKDEIKLYKFKCYE